MLGGLRRSVTSRWKILHGSRRTAGLILESPLCGATRERVNVGAVMHHSPTPIIPQNPGFGHKVDSSVKTRIVCITAIGEMV